MSIHLIAIGFDQDPPMGNTDLLLYMGFDPQTEGRQVQGDLQVAELNVGGADTCVTALRILDETVHSTNLTLVFPDAYDQNIDGHWTMTPQRKAQVRDVIETICSHLNVTLTPENYSVYEVEGVSAIVINGAAEALHRTIVKSTRSQFHSI